MRYLVIFAVSIAALMAVSGCKKEVQQRACETANCFVPFYCVAKCGEPKKSNGCCPCEVSGLIDPATCPQDEAKAPGDELGPRSKLSSKE